MTRITKKEAIKLTGLDSKTFENYFKVADEFSCLPRQDRGRYYFDKDALARWLTDYQWRTLFLDKADYYLCLDFALAMHFRGYVVSDWGTGRQREFGQKLTNWVKGQLAEVAVQKFLKRDFGIDIELDFELHGEIVPQDVIGVIENNAKRDPHLKIGIKSSKPKNSYLVLSPNEVDRAERKSEVYIFCRPDIPDDHFLKINNDAVREAVKNQPHYTKYKDSMKGLEDIACEIAGWCKVDELEQVTSIPGQEFSGFRYVKKTGRLKRSRDEWQTLVDMM